MKALRVSAFAIAMALVAFSAPASAAGLKSFHDPARPMLAASHRACWKMTSENAIDGIRACIARGIDMVEVDVRTTKDGHLILMHDETVDRTTNGHGAVADLAERDVTALLLRERGGGEKNVLTRRHVPTLAAALAVVRNRILVNLDVKAAALDQILDEVVAAHAQSSVLLNVSLDADPAVVACAKASGIALQLVDIEHDRKLSDSEFLAKVEALQPDAVQVIFDRDAAIDHLHALLGNRGGALFVNTMTSDIATGHPMNLSGSYTDAGALENPDAVWGRLIQTGVSIIQTDEPQSLLQYLSRRTW